MIFSTLGIIFLLALTKSPKAPKRKMDQTRAFVERIFPETEKTTSEVLESPQLSKLKHDDPSSSKDEPISEIEEKDIKPSKRPKVPKRKVGRAKVSKDDPVHKGKVMSEEEREILRKKHDRLRSLRREYFKLKYSNNPNSDLYKPQQLGYGRTQYKVLAPFDQWIRAQSKFPLIPNSFFENLERDYEEIPDLTEEDYNVLYKISKDVEHPYSFLLLKNLVKSWRDYRKLEATDPDLAEKWIYMQIIDMNLKRDVARGEFHHFHPSSLIPSCTALEPSEEHRNCHRLRFILSGLNFDQIKQIMDIVNRV